MQTDAQFSFDLARYTRVVNRVIYKEWQKGLSRSCWQYTLFENWKTSPYVVNQQSLALWWTGNVPRTTSYLSISSLRTCRKRLSGGRHASELLVRSPMSCTNRDGKKLLEASKSWLPSGVGLMAASPEHLSEWSQYSVDTGLTMYADDHQIYEIAGKEVVSQLQQSATLTTNWYDSNLLQGNLQKYQMMNYNWVWKSKTRWCNYWW